MDIGADIAVRSRDRIMGQLGEDEYHKLIARGAEEITANVEAALNSFELVSAAITGGRDSRVVLAALVAIGRVSDVRFKTLDIGMDLDIASGLVKRYGASYGTSMQARRLEVTSLAANIDRFRSLTYGAAYHFPSSVRRTHFKIPESPCLSLGGGCGELYRSFYQRNAFDKRNMMQGYTPDTLKEMLQSSGFWRRIYSEHHLEAIIDPYAETFDSLKGDTLWRKLDDHYLNFRNRIHFGSGLGFTSVIGWNPLASTSLLQASWGLPIEVRDTGRVMFDITRYLCDDLAHTAYDTPSRDFSVLPYHLKGKNDGRTFSVEPARELIRPLTASSSYPAVSPPVAPDFDDFLFLKVEGLFQELRKGTLRYYASDPAWKEICWFHRNKKHGHIHKWYNVLLFLCEASASADLQRDHAWEAWFDGPVCKPPHG